MAVVYELNTTKKFGRNSRKGEISYLVNAIYKDKIIEFSLTDEKGKTVMFNLCSKSIASVYNSGDRAKLGRQLIKIFEVSNGEANVKKAEKFANKSTTSNRPKPKAKYICDKAHSKECAEMAKAQNNGVYDQKIYETIAQANGWWIKNPNA